MRHLVILLLLVGCAKSKPALIDMRPLTILFDGKPIAKLHPDGHMEAVGPGGPGDKLLPGPTLHADGTIVLTKNGVTARLGADGAIDVTHQGKTHRFGRIANNRLDMDAGGVEVVGGRMAYYSGEKNVVGFIDGPVDDRRRHTSLVMFAAFMIDLSIQP